MESRKKVLCSAKMESGNKKWTVSETRNLISQFEDSPCLWDMFSKDYKSKDMKSMAVTKIASSLGVKVDEVKRKMHNLRCQYTSELKKTRIKKSGKGLNKRYLSQWPYFDAFKFLEAAVNVRESTGNLLLQPGEKTRSGLEPIEEEETSQNEDQLEDSDLHFDDTQVNANIQHNQSQYSRVVITARKKNELKRKREAEEDAILKKASAVLDKARRSSDDLSVFGDFVASELRGLRNDSVRRNAKRNIQRILLDAGIEDDNFSRDLNFQSSSRMSTP